ncbi:hypothetical protein F4803DRAFT_122144 [Xylaria telfairii]|nr:hypothetical protein F4803DRAFT_122144 [Xylaria telfairii]
MSQFPHDDKQSPPEEVNNRAFDWWHNLGNTVLGAMDSENRGHPSLAMPYDHSDWVPVQSSDSEDSWSCTTSTEDQVYSESPASRHSAAVPSSDPFYNAVRLAEVEAELENARESERAQTSVVRAQEKSMFDLVIRINKEQHLSRSIGGKLSDLFVVVTQNQQYELDKVQRRLLELQVDAESGCFGQTWRDLQQKLHNINHKLDGYIELSTPKAILAGTQTDELTLFLGGLFADLPKMRKELERLSRYIEEEKVTIDVGNVVQDDKDACERAVKEHTRWEEDDSADLSASCSMTDILDRYYSFSRLHREMMETRKVKLQELLGKTSIELSRLQADLAYEKGRTANMRTRAIFWGDGLGESRVECPYTLLENLEMKQFALERGSQELEQIVETVQGLPPRFHIIDIVDPEEYKASTNSQSAYNPAKGVPGDSSCADITSQREDTMYIAELEEKLKEKQANEKAWGAHFESLHRRENEAKAALKQQLDSMELKNKELQNVVTVVTAKLFQRRERLWDLSGTARQLGEELISTLEQLGILCDKPLVRENGL